MLHFVFAGLAITVLATITEVGGNDADQWAKSAQNFLICLEMLLFSIAHFYCFPTDEWEPDYRANFKKSKFGDSIALGDFLSDIKLIMKGNSKKKKKKQPSEPTVPECDEENEEETDNGEVEEDENDEGDIEQGTEETSTIASEDMGGASNSNSERQEIEEARNRLLQTGLLDDLLFIQPRQPSPNISETVSQDETSRLIGPLYGATDDQWTRLLESPSEGSNFVSAATTPSTPLRPSIFTTIAALAENDDHQENVGSSSTQ
jgi:Organic solute transporter Ostalpha